MEHFREIILPCKFEPVKSFMSRNRLKSFLYLALATILFNGAYHLCNFASGRNEENYCEIISNLTSGSGGDVI